MRAYRNQIIKEKFLQFRFITIISVVKRYCISLILNYNFYVLAI